MVNSPPSTRSTRSLKTQPKAIERVPWEEHYDYLDCHWEPGQHCSIIAPTGKGKSYLIDRGLLPLWVSSRVVVIDPTEDDRNYGYIGKSGRLPTRLDRAVESERDPDWHRMVPQYDRKSRESVRDCLARVYRDGKWVIVLDETRVVTDTKAPCYGLTAYYEQLMLRARKRDVTVIAGTQAPRWMPASFYEQPTYLYVGRVRDKRGRKRLEEISGVDFQDIEHSLNSLQQYEFLFIGPEDTLQIVQVPKD